MCNVLTLLSNCVHSETRAELPCAIISLSYNTKMFTEFNKLYDAMLYCSTLTHASSYLTLFVDLRLATLCLLIMQYIQITPCED